MRTILLLLAVYVGLCTAQLYRGILEKTNPWSSLTAYPTVITSPTETITVTWKNISFGSASDWIGVWSDKDVKQLVAPIKFKYVSSGGKYPKSEGSVTFNLENRRTSYVFCYLTGGAQYPTIKAISNTVTQPNLFAPLQPHLALVPGQNNQMALTWNCKGHNKPVWKIGTESGHYPISITPKVTTYTKKDMCDIEYSPAGGIGWFDPGYFLTAIATDLTPGQKYYYVFGDVYGMSDEQSFFAAPALGAATSSPTVMVGFGDMGQVPSDGSLQHSWDFHNHGEIPTRNTSKLMLHLVNQGQAMGGNTFVMHIGDISYAVGFLSEWDQFMEMISPIASKVPYMTGIGNHEMGWTHSFYGPPSDSGGECGVAFLSRFPHVSKHFSPPAMQTPWYTYQYGLATVVVMSTEHNFTRGSEQWFYLKKALSSVDRSVTPWLIFTGHRPMYADDTWKGDALDARMLQDALEELLYQNGVNLALWGHVHFYMKTCPVYRGNCMGEGDAPRHLIIGSAGYSLSKSVVPKGPLQPWVEKLNADHYGIGNFIFHNASVATVQWVNNEAPYEVLDSFEVYNKHT